MSAPNLKCINRVTETRKFSIIHNEDALNCLLLATSRSEMFARVWNKNDRLSFMCLFHQERFDKGEILIEHGSPLLKFYVVDEGAFEILTPKEEALNNTTLGYDLYNDESAWKLETVLYENEHFGEPALENAVLSRGRKIIKAPFRVRCSFPSRVWCVSGETFMRRWDVMQEALMKEIRYGISKFSILREWIHMNPGKEHALIQKCKVVDLGPEECVIRQSALGKNVYVLIKGHAQSYEDEGTTNPLMRHTGTYSSTSGIFGIEALRGMPYKESVVISSRRSKLIVIPARV